jgi:hypothetical protein
MDVNRSRRNGGKEAGERGGSHNGRPTMQELGPISKPIDFFQNKGDFVPLLKI